MLISLDISTSCTGYCVFNDDGKLIEMDCVKFNSKHSMFEKLEQFKEKIKHVTLLPITKIAIEEPMQRMQGKFSSAGTIAVLNFFNGMVSSYMYHTFKVEPVYYNVTNARNLAFPGIFKKTGRAENFDIKHEVWSKVMELEPQINWRYGPRSNKLTEENYDMSDSYVIGIAYMITEAKQKKSSNNQESSSK